MDPPTEYVTYGPEEAQAALDNMPARQRTLLQPAQVERITRDMSSGNFVADNGQTVKFNAEGRLLDGQHRMLAIIRSGQPQRLLTVRGIDDANWEGIDVGGRVRYPHHILRARGVKEANRTSAAIRFLWLYENGLSFNISGGIKPTMAERNDLERRHPRILEAYSLVRKYPGLPLGALACVAYLLTSKYGPAAEQFLSRLREGLSNSIDDPVLQLNRRLTLASSARTPVSAGEAGHLMRVAFRNYLSGSAPRYLVVRDQDAPIKV